MDRQLMDRDGQPLVLHRPTGPDRGESPGIRIVKPEDQMGTKAPHRGIYTLNGKRFRIQAGDVLPEGAVMDQAGEQRSQGNAPENKSQGNAPENRSGDPTPPAKPEGEKGSGDDKPDPLDPLGELTDEAFAALSPAEKGQRTKAAKAAAEPDAKPEAE